MVHHGRGCMQLVRGSEDVPLCSMLTADCMCRPHLGHCIKEVLLRHGFPASREWQTCPPLCRRCARLRLWRWGTACQCIGLSACERLRDGRELVHAVLCVAATACAPASGSGTRDSGCHLASSSKRMSRSQFMVRVCIWKIWVRDSKSGSPNSTCAAPQVASWCRSGPR